MPEVRTGEGVEDDVTRDELVGAGCLMAQGFLWSRPLPVGTLDSWLVGTARSEVR